MNRVSHRFFYVVLSMFLCTHLPSAPANAEDQFNEDFSTQISCDDALSRAEQLNGMMLFRGAASCSRENRLIKMNYLSTVGWIRGHTDAMLLVPENGTDRLKAAELYRFIFLQANSPAYYELYDNPQLYSALFSDQSQYDELYRDPEQTEDLIRLIDAWHPSFEGAYSPGWNYQRGNRADQYNDALSRTVASQRDRIQKSASLMINDEYYAAKRESEELAKRSGGRFRGGSEESKRWNELRTIMVQVQRRILPPPSKTKTELPLHIDLFPDINFRQLAVGWNGPASGEVLRLKSEDAVENSWLADAMSSSRLSEILSQVNFSSQIVIVYATGERTTATGNLILRSSKFGPNSENSLHLVMKVGINDSDCEQAPTNSYPFVVAVTSKPEKSFSDKSTSESNFRDGCHPPKSAVPVN